MKQYFAKYLPVEREPKEGDMVIYKEVGWTENYEEALKAAIYGDPIPIKVKLFLCTKDIQIGDKVSNNQGAVIPWTQDMQIMFETGILLRDGLFKVMGEISSGVTWVKEGDEFDEDQWRNAKHADGMIYVDYEKNSLNKDEYKIEIVCPTCKKFH